MTLLKQRPNHLPRLQDGDTITTAYETIAELLNRSEDKPDPVQQSSPAPATPQTPHPVAETRVRQVPAEPRVQETAAEPRVQHSPSHQQVLQNPNPSLAQAVHTPDNHAKSTPVIPTNNVTTDLSQ